MSSAAEEIHGHGNLAQFITGAYPMSWVKRQLAIIGLKDHRKFARLLAREGSYPEKIVKPIFIPEAVMLLGVMLRQFEGLGLGPLTNVMIRFAFRWYGRIAAGIVRRADPSVSVYHYRAGYGGKSVAAARKNGMAILCDHSIAHPNLLDFFVENNGQWLEKGESGPVDLLWTYIREDFERADHVLVNSDFVKDTFTHVGWEKDRVHVIYLGVDDSFLDGVPEISMVDDGEKVGPPKLIFAGNFDTRKGADVLIEALTQIDHTPWTLDIIGTIGAGARGRYAGFLADERVTAVGMVDRAELARRMVEANVFVFPSLAEGSARVIFEAMSSACYVITTPNTGSIVEDDVHGSLIPPGDVASTVAAIRSALDQPQRVKEIGHANAALVRRNYTQAAYGKNLDKLYKFLLEKPE